MISHSSFLIFHFPANYYKGYLLHANRSLNTKFFVKYPSKLHNLSLFDAETRYPCFSKNGGDLLMAKWTSFIVTWTHQDFPRSLSLYAGLRMRRSLLATESVFNGHPDTRWGKFILSNVRQYVNCGKTLEFRILWWLWNVFVSRLLDIVSCIFWESPNVIYPNMRLEVAM